MGPWERVLDLLPQRFPLWVAAAVIGGIAAPAVALPLQGSAPVLLAAMMLGLGLRVPLGELRRALAWRGALVVAVVLPFVVLPPLGLAVGHLSSDWALRAGLAAVAAAPAEVTSALMVVLAAGEVGLGAAVMALSNLFSAALTPLALGWALGQEVPISAMALMAELSLFVLLPFLAGSAGATRWRRGLEREGLALSAAAVLALVFLAAGRMGALGLRPDHLPLLLACALLLGGGFLLGELLGRVLRLPPGARRALIFTVGMREFGVAIAVSLRHLPPGAAAAAVLYGLLMMVGASLLARWLARRAAGGERVIVGPKGDGGRARLH